MKERCAAQVDVGFRAITTHYQRWTLLWPRSMWYCMARGSAATPKTVHAVFGERAMKVLLPLNRVRVEIVGAGTGTLNALIAQSLFRVCSLVNEVLPA